jgi:hypothetical protein
VKVLACGCSMKSEITSGTGEPIDQRLRILYVLVKSFKTSKAWKLKLIKTGDQFQTMEIYSNDRPDLLQTVFENGVIIKDHTFEDIRERAKIKTYKQYNGIQY